ncbi:MAG: hypothetical protein IJ091_02375 [Oscillospiraceae bacterium]|nr:hypothetical protein [Oscillospiraceae bacterium]
MAEYRRTHSVGFSEEYLSKKNCLKKAREIIDNHFINGMTELEISREIFFHAWAYHFAVWAEQRKLHMFSIVRRAADPIDLADGGDTMIRRFIYLVFWMLPIGR